MDVGKGHSQAYNGVFVKDSSDSACLIPDSWICTSDHDRSSFLPLSVLHPSNTKSFSSFLYTLHFLFCRSCHFSTVLAPAISSPYQTEHLLWHMHFEVPSIFAHDSLTMGELWHKSQLVTACMSQELLSGLSRLPPILPVGSLRVLMHPPWPCSHGTGNLDDVFPWCYLTRDSCQGYTMCQQLSSWGICMFWKVFWSTLVLVLCPDTHISSLLWVVPAHLLGLSHRWPGQSRS